MGQVNIRYLALLVRRLIDRLDGMIRKREVLLRSVERCGKNETCSEKMDPFLVHLHLEPLDTLEASSISDPKSSALYLPGEADSSGIVFQPTKIDHQFVCECDPCTCEVQVEEIEQTGLNAPVSKVSEDFRKHSKTE